MRPHWSSVRNHDRHPVGDAEDDLPNDEIARPLSGSGGIPLLTRETPTALRVPPGVHTDTRTGAQEHRRCLRELAAERPDDVAFVALLDGDAPQASLSYAQLTARAGAIAVHLQDARLAGRNVVLAYPPGLEFIAAFFGASTPAVSPCRLPAPVTNARSFPRAHRRRPERPGAQHRRHRRLYEDNQRQAAAVRWIATDEITTSMPVAGTEHDPDPIRWR